MIRFTRWLAFLALLLPGVAHAQRQGPVVLAAASLQEALSDAADRWAAARHPRPILSFAASSTLARQIVAGAPADLFISADAAWMDDIAAKGLVRPRTRDDFLGNRLVLIAPAKSRIAIPIRPGFPLARALGSGRLAMADPAAVPAGRYGQAALRKLGVWRSVAARIAPADNVRAALALVERGEAPLGIVYATDAHASRAVRVVAVFPAASHPPIVYPMAILQRARHPDAEPFRRFLLSRQGKAIFTAHGFLPLP